MPKAIFRSGFPCVDRIRAGERGAPFLCPGLSDSVFPPLSFFPGARGGTKSTRPRRCKARLTVGISPPLRDRGSTKWSFFFFSWSLLFFLRLIFFPISAQALAETLTGGYPSFFRGWQVLFRILFFYALFFFTLVFFLNASSGGAQVLFFPSWSGFPLAFRLSLQLYLPLVSFFRVRLPSFFVDFVVLGSAPSVQIILRGGTTSPSPCGQGMAAGSSLLPNFPSFFSQDGVLRVFPLPGLSSLPSSETT